ncbi:unnamed protein product [Moneuplotes crassus]|uniref:Uncharacterized protein n=1 Tax=Euplotes crassus TaxID=5936 RepID=A0AAD1UE10_EUPCR|nr:unnamed protein product [Moneuplotes crassus]
MKSEELEKIFNKRIKDKGWSKLFKDIQHEDSEEIKGTSLSSSRKSEEFAIYGREKDSQKIEISGSEMLTEKLDSLIQIYCEVSGISQEEIILEIAESLSNKQKLKQKLMEAFKDSFKNLKLNWNDKNAIQKSVGSCIKNIPMLLINMKGFYPSRNKGSRNCDYHLAAYLRTFMIGFVPIFYSETWSYKQDQYEEIFCENNDTMMDLFLDFILIKYPSKRVKYAYSKILLRSQKLDGMLLKLKGRKATQNRIEFQAFCAQNASLNLIAHKTQLVLKTLKLKESQLEIIEELFSNSKTMCADFKDSLCFELAKN